jgi:hypothetical protein
MKKRPITPFSLAFLDIMFCGFGAVVLLVMLLNGQVLQSREVAKEDLRGEADRAGARLEIAQDTVARLQAALDQLAAEEEDLADQLARLQDSVQQSRRQASSADQDLQKRQQEIDALRRQNAALANAKAAIEAQKVERPDADDSSIGFTGDGRRQYLTGLTLGAERTLILLDASASMLDETIVNIVRRKLMSAEIRRQAPKWQRAVRSLHWLVANLRQDKKFQVYVFNTEAHAVIEDTDGKWLDSSDAKQLQAAIDAVRAIAPDKGTSLHKAFQVIGRLKPKPDSIVLLTDGLPTQGDRATGAATIAAEDRLALFKTAITRIPTRVPVNTLLFPIEGDPDAAAAFWSLAIDTKGSFITPSRDWP